MEEAVLKELYASLNLAMTFKDFLHIQNYFRNEEKRDPSMTEIRVLDTYWSDHCRHTTFSTAVSYTHLVTGVTLTGFKYPLRDHTFTSTGSAGLGVSNEILAEEGRDVYKRQLQLDAREAGVRLR